MTKPPLPKKHDALKPQPKTTKEYVKIKLHNLRIELFLSILPPDLTDQPNSIAPTKASNHQSTTDLLDALINHFSNGEATSAIELEPKIRQRLSKQLAASEFFGQDMSNLWLMLERAITQSSRQPGQNSQLRLLNLACGHCEESALLSAFFNRSTHRLQQFAMDLRPQEIDKARRRYTATESLFRDAGIPGVRAENEPDAVEFVADDATHLVGYGQVPSEFDVVFIRHQNLWHDELVWRKIYEFALHRIEPKNGALIITSYFDREHVLAVQLLKAIGGTVLFSEPNPNSRSLNVPGKSIDRHVALIAQNATLL